MIPEHSGHCRACKERVRELLIERHGACDLNRSFPWSAKPQAYGTTPIGKALQSIVLALAAFRGHGDFIKSDLVPPCDFFVANPPFILEFDESQHFTRARLEALSLYPENIKLGFPLNRWQDLCRQVDAQDQQPIDRDERRAWYDTLRDLVPSLYGFKPTIRLYAGEFAWCSLDAGSDKDRSLFRTLLQDRLPTPR